MKLLIAWADIHVVVCVVMEFLLAKEPLSHCKASLRTRDVSFNTGSFTSSDILALVVAAVSDCFDLVGFQRFFGGSSRWWQWSESSASVGPLLSTMGLFLHPTPTCAWYPPPPLDFGPTARLPEPASKSCF